MTPEMLPLRGSQTPQTPGTDVDDESLSAQTLSTCSAAKRRRLLLRGSNQAPSNFYFEVLYLVYFFYFFLDFPLIYSAFVSIAAKNAALEVVLSCFKDLRPPSGVFA